MTSLHSNNASRYAFSRPADTLLIVACVAAIAGLTVLRATYAASMELRVDEAYYWTWSKENVLSFLDHPPMVAWAIRLGTALFGDTNFGVRFSGLLAMAVMQLLLADIVWRTVRDLRCALIAALLPEAAVDYGLMMAKVAPDTALIAFELAMAWALVRTAKSGNLKWWLPAAVFGGLSLLSKYTAVLLVPGLLAFVLIPDWRRRQLASPYLWAAPLIALTVFSPVLIWNAIHGWPSLRFQTDRALHEPTLRFLGEYVGLQFALIGPLLLPVVAIGAAMRGWRGIWSNDAVAILLAACGLFPLLFFLLLSLFMRIGDSWTLFAWPLCFACAAINLALWRREAPGSRRAAAAMPVAAFSIVSGAACVAAAAIYYLASDKNYAGRNDPIGKEAGFAALVASADQDRRAIGATWFATTDYRSYAMLRWRLKDSVPVVQLNERNRFIGFKPPGQLGPVALYLTPADRPWLRRLTSARLEPVGRIALVWRGVVYDQYVTQKLSNWTPVLNPPPGDPFFVGAPH